LLRAKFPGMPTELQIGSRVKAGREGRGWSQADLAAKAGVTQQLVSLIEAGHSTGSERTRAALAEALGVPVAVLVYGAGAAA
jgi:HTH-type transcriptional regulator/antitoxin HipB